MSDIINVDVINSLLEVKPTEDQVNEILNKALMMKGLDLKESAMLLNIQDEKLLDKVFHAAKELKEKIYGKRIVLFTPLYASNYCSNNCVYCAFRRDNECITRRHLTPEEVVEEAKAIMRQGHKRIILLTGEEYKKAGLDYLEEIMDRIYHEKVFNGEIRRINVNIAPLSVEDFKRLNSFGIGTYQLFQETYHEETYTQVHPSGKKSDYNWRLEAMDRALEAGINDIGIGPLFGLADHKFETLATLMHSEYLDKKHGVGPHTISVPRIEPAEGVAFSKNPTDQMSDIEFKKIVAVIRLAVPYTGLVLSTREKPQLRKELLELGISQISAGSKTNPGGYSVYKDSSEQFEMSDSRELDEIVLKLLEGNFIPSFCTSCYRKGRTGKDFMDLAKPGLIKRFCNTNALLTLKEYIDDYGNEELKTAGNALIEKEINSLEDEKIKVEIRRKLDRIKNGERDVYI
jgi:2-iminoacetate synthase